MSLIELKNVSYSYDKAKIAVKNVTLSIEQGEYVAIVGHNGSGKSTLAKIMNGLLIPYKGELIVDGFNSNDKKSVYEIRKRVGVVFQNPDNQLVASIVEDDVAFGPENLGVPRKEIGERIDFALSSVNMQEFRHCSPTRLSGGQKQRIAIAGVLALKPMVLVLDESTAMLDPKGRKEVLAVAEKLNKEQGTTIVSITHFMDEVVLADRVIVLKDGEIALEGTPEQIYERKEQLAECGLELPLATVLANELRAKGVNLPSGILTEEQLRGALCELKQKI